jgi:hypothetical protein
MKCLSVQQPWAWALIHGTKRVENRTWRTKYRGAVIIHAGVSDARLKGTTPADWHGEGLTGLPAFAELPFGAVVGTVRLVDCVPLAEVLGRPFAEGPWCWIVADPAPCVPVPWKGQQMLFDVPASVLTPA